MFRLTFSSLGKLALQEKKICSGDPYYYPHYHIFTRKIASNSGHDFFPISIYKTDDNSLLAQTIAFRYLSKDLELVTRIERFKLLSSPDTFQDILNFIRKEIQKLQSFETRCFEIELFEEISAPVYFPATLSVIGTYNTVDDVELFRSAGFKQVNERFCYEFKLEQLDFKSLQSHRDINFCFIQRGSILDTEKCNNLWYSCENFPVLVPNEALWIDWSDASYVLSSPEFTIFAEISGSLAGFVCWWPDIHPIMESLNLMVVGEKEAKKIIENLSHGKIFKVGIKKEYKRNGIEPILCKRAMKIMKELGYTRCQIGGIGEHDLSMLEMVRELNGERVNKLVTMRQYHH